MQIINTEPTLYDEIFFILDANQHERITYAYFLLKNKPGDLSTEVHKKAHQELAKYIFEITKSSYKEEDVLKRLLRYVQILITSGKYEEFRKTALYTDLYYSVAIIIINSVNRIGKVKEKALLFDKRLKFNNFDIRVNEGNRNDVELLSNDFYDDLSSKIPIK